MDCFPLWCGTGKVLSGWPFSARNYLLPLVYDCGAASARARSKARMCCERATCVRHRTTCASPSLPLE